MGFKRALTGEDGNRERGRGAMANGWWKGEGDGAFGLGEGEGLGE